MSGASPDDAHASDPEGVGARLAAQRAHLELCYRHLVGRSLRRSVDVEDVVSEVWLRALRAELPPLEEPGERALRRYLAVICRHVVVDAARAVRAARRGGREHALGRADWSAAGSADWASPAPGPATRAASKEQEERLRRAFDTLPGEYRRVLGLRQFEGLSARETGRRMGRSESAVHSLYRRALLAWGQAGGIDS